MPDAAIGRERVRVIAPQLARQQPIVAVVIAPAAVIAAAIVATEAVAGVEIAR
jgi:hypothetical protein